MPDDRPIIQIILLDALIRVVNYHRFVRNADAIGQNSGVPFVAGQTPHDDVAGLPGFEIFARGFERQALAVFLKNVIWFGTRRWSMFLSVRPSFHLSP